VGLAVGVDVTRDLARELACEGGDLRGRWSHEVEEEERPLGTFVDEDPVGQQPVKVDVGVQGRAEMLHEGDGPRQHASETVATTHCRAGCARAMGARRASLPRKERAHEDRMHLREERGITSEEQAYGPREREDPLAVGHAGQHVALEVKRGVVHPSRVT
jgi:hypothetical protein